MPTSATRSAAIGLTLVLAFALVFPAGQATAQSRRQPAREAAPQNLSDCSGCPSLVMVPAGAFLMGSPESEKGRGKDEGPQHKVQFAKPFAIGKYEVTFAEWDACAAQGASSGGCQHKPSDEGWGRKKLPVVNVSWSDANQYVGWLAKKTGKAYRLPSEAEWEYAARGPAQLDGATVPFATGTVINYKLANYDANFTYGLSKRGLYRQKTVEVGSLPANGFGIHEMHGNAWEWVQDCYKADYVDAPPDGSAVAASDCTLRVLRGGAWNYHPQLLRSAYRYSTPGDVRLNNTGFRVARDL